jgi:CheY-like chemotaxis protein
MSASRILVVDDNLLNVELAVYLLQTAGFVVESQADSTAALHHVEQFQPALILMDIQMPGIDGLTLTRQIKGDPATRGIVVLAFTAYAMHGDEERLRAAGCDGYLSKPISVSTFVDTVRASLPAAV